MSANISLYPYRTKPNASSTRFLYVGSVDSAYQHDPDLRRFRVKRLFYPMQSFQFKLSSDYFHGILGGFRTCIRDLGFIKAHSLQNVVHSLLSGPITYPGSTPRTGWCNDIELTDTFSELPNAIREAN